MKETRFSEKLGCYVEISNVKTLNDIEYCNVETKKTHSNYILLNQNLKELCLTEKK